MKSLGYLFLAGLVRAVSLLPFSILYFISDILSWLLWYLIPYRKSVVKDNLRNAFPEKSEIEINRLARKFYSHFCDVIVEGIKLMTISYEEIAKRIRFEDEEMLSRLHSKGIHLMLLMGHYGNWEWLASLSGGTVPYQFMTIYKTLENKYMDRLMTRLRSRFGTEAVPMQRAFRNVQTRIEEQQISMMCFIADQNPDGHSLRHWLPFMGREVPVLAGAETIARKFNLGVVFLHNEKISRGHYLVHLELLTEHAAEMPVGQLTEIYFRKLESEIRSCPENWLWTHRRWKHKKPANL